VPDLERLVSEHPYRERLWALLIRGLYRQGRQGEALGAFDRARHVLGDELGVAPGRELRDLHAQVLAQDPRLDPPDPVTSPDSKAVLPPDLVPDGPLFGRGRELDRLLTLWAQAREGATVCVAVRGPAAAADCGWPRNLPPRPAPTARWSRACTDLPERRTCYAVPAW